MKKWHFSLLVAATLLIWQPAWAIPISYSGSGTGYDSNGVVRNITGHLVIDDQVDQVIGPSFHITSFSFQIEGLAALQGADGLISELPYLLPDNTVQYGNNEFSVGSNGWVTFGPAYFLMPDYSQYAQEDYLSYQLPFALDLSNTVFDNYASLVSFGSDLVLTQAPVPEPATFILVGCGLLGAMGMKRKFRRS